ncbi:MAG: hypothetical protein ABSA41_01925 [Terriglobia bacterium]
MTRLVKEWNPVGRHAATKMQIFEARHPGLCQNVDAMFEAFTPLRAVAAVIQTQYGEHISHTSIWTYKRQSWNVRRDQIQARKVVLTAFQELASEERI